MDWRGRGESSWERPKEKELVYGIAEQEAEKEKLQKKIWKTQYLHWKAERRYTHSPAPSGWLHFLWESLPN